MRRQRNMAQMKTTKLQKKTKQNGDKQSTRYTVQMLVISSLGELGGRADELRMSTA